MKQLIFSILAITLITSFIFLKYPSPQPSQEEETINSRNFFKQWGKKAHKIHSNTLQSTQDQEDVPPIVTYGINFILNIENQNKDQKLDKFNTTTKVTAQCDVQTIFDEEKNIFDVAVSYSMIEKNTQSISEQINSKLSSTQQDTEIDGEIEQYFEEQDIEVTQIQNYFYLVQVGADSGEVISIQIESEFDEDLIITNATEQLINDIFPEMRTNSYQQGIVQNDSMGQVHVDYTKDDIDSNNIVIYKEYNNNDYLQVKVPELGIPKLNYERNTIVENKTGVVKEGKMEYTLQLGNDYEQETKLQSDNENEQEKIKEIEALGQLNSEIISTFWIISPTQEDQHIAEEMYRYRNQAVFEQKRLSTQMKSEIVYGDDEETDFELVDIDQQDEEIEVDEDLYINSEKPYFSYIDEQKSAKNEFTQKLGYTKPIINEVKKLASVKVLGNKLTVEADYTGYSYQSDLALRVKVGNKTTATILQKTFEHCYNYENTYNIQKKYNFFKATYVVYGMILVPIQASGQVNFSYTVKSGVENEKCTVKLLPGINIKFYADGQASLAGIISAGVYSQGTLLDSQLVLDSELKNPTLRTSLSGKFKAAQLDIGITYDLITCSLEKVRRRKLTQDEGNIKLRRNLFFRRVFQKVKRTAQKAVNKAVSTVKKVTAVARKAVEFVVELTQVCKSTQGNIAIFSKKTKAKSKVIFNKEVDLRDL